MPISSEIQTGLLVSITGGLIVAALVGVFKLGFKGLWNWLRRVVSSPKRDASSPQSELRDIFLTMAAIAALTIYVSLLPLVFDILLPLPSRMGVFFRLVMGLFLSLFGGMSLVSHVTSFFFTAPLLRGLSADKEPYPRLNSLGKAMSLFLALSMSATGLILIAKLKTNS